jgi:hypothetical protein
MRLPALLRSIDGLSSGQRVRLLAGRAVELAGLLGEFGRGSGLLAHAYLATAGPRSGWSPEWRGVLVALRNHPAAAVRRRALDLATAVE